jgi:hypothetical protein
MSPTSRLVSPRIVLGNVLYAVTLAVVNFAQQACTAAHLRLVTEASPEPQQVSNPSSNLASDLPSILASVLTGGPFAIKTAANQHLRVR